MILLQLQGLQYHLDIIGRQQNLISHNWKDLQVITWTITEQLKEPMQTDGYVAKLNANYLFSYFEYSALYNHAAHLAVCSCSNLWNIGMEIHYLILLHRFLFLVFWNNIESMPC
jgi:hypothetical protein